MKIRFITAILALLLFVFVSQWIIDSYVLVSLYIATASVWRDFGEMLRNLPLTIFFMFIMSTWATYAFSKIFPEGGFNNGLRFGFYMGIFIGIFAASWYLWMPVPPLLAVGWFLTRFLQVLICGMILGTIYKKRSYELL